MNIKLLFADMHRKLEQLSKLKKEGSLDHVEDELNKLAFQSAEIAEEWLKFEEKLGQVLTEEGFENNGPENIDWKKGKALYDLFMFAEAIPYLKQVVAEHPEFEQAKLYLAHAYLEEGIYKQAKYYLQFLVQTTDDQEIINLAYHTLGCMEGKLKNYSQAHYYFEKVKITELKKEWQATYIFNYALSLFHETKFEDCLKKLIDYYQLAPRDWKGPYMLGKVYLALGDEEAGISFWFEALQLQENKILLKEMAKHFEARKLYQMAALCYQRLLEDRGNARDKQAWFGLAWSYGLVQKIELSEESYLKALCLFPSDLDLLISYTWMLILWDKKEKAGKIISKLMKHKPEHPLIKGLPLIYAGKYREALQILSTV